MSVTPTKTTLDDFMHDYIVAATGLTGNRVIIGRSNKPAPKELHASLMRRTSGGKGTPSIKLRNHDTDPTLMIRTVKKWGTASYSIKFYYIGSNDKAHSMKDFNSTDAGLLLTEERKIYIDTTSEVRDLSELLSEKYTEAAQIDVNIKYDEIRTETVNALESVEITLNVSAETDITENLEV